MDYFKEQRQYWIAWAKANLPFEPMPVPSITKQKPGAVVRFTRNSIKKSLGDRFSRDAEVLAFVRYWETALLTSIYVTIELPIHQEQTNVACYHRLRYQNAQSGRSYDLVIRELTDNPVMDVYFIHPTNEKGVTPAAS